MDNLNDKNRWIFYSEDDDKQEKLAQLRDAVYAYPYSTVRSYRSTQRPPTRNLPE